MTDATGAFVLRSETQGSAVVVQLRPRSGSKGAHVLSWQDAHRVANVAAAQAHAGLVIDLSGTKIDVVGAIRRADIELMWQPLPNLFGAFVNEPGSTPGILINSGLPRGARRHTAAHELGHAQLAHSTTIDDGSSIDTVFADEVDAIPPASRRRGWPDQEKAAEAFAVWFLMPRRVVVSALKVLDLTRPRSADDVYRLSLLLGTSYRTTLRHIPNLRLASSQECNVWARIAPSTIKARLDRDVVPPSSRRPEVWELTPRYNGLRVELEPGDRIVLPRGAVVGDEVPEWMRSVPSVGPGAMTTCLEVGAISEARSFTLYANPGWSVDFDASPVPQGLDPRRPR